MREIWKDIIAPINFTGLYQISNKGQVKNLQRSVKSHIGTRIAKEHILNNIGKENGYLAIGLWRDNKEKRLYVHRLVALHFISNPDNKRTVNHKDGNKSNNNVDNLEWYSHSQNNKHALDMGLRQSARGERQGHSKLCNEQVWKIRALKSYYSNAEIGRMFKISGNAIHNIVNYKTWRHI